MILPEDKQLMRLAIAASAQALAAGDGPFGAALAKGGRSLHVARNNQISSGDVMGHAEVVLVREVVQVHGKAALDGATVYASGEPCAMCCGAMFWAGVRRVVYAATQADIIEALGGMSLPIESRAVVAGAEPAVEIDGPVLRDAAVAVLRRARDPLRGLGEP